MLGYMYRITRIMEMLGRNTAIFKCPLADGKGAERQNGAQIEKGMIL